jgi:hypothetical protein
MRRLLIIMSAVCASAASWAQSFDIHVPTAVVAGGPATLATTGNGKATFYLVGPGVSRKEDVELGREIQLHSEYLQNAGAYLSIVCTDACKHASFFVNATKPASLTFLAHPSRVPVSQGDSVSGVAFPFDSFHNLVLTPVAVNFQLAQRNTSLLSRTVRTENGVAWFRTNSGKSAGTLQVNAILDNLAARRVVQQVASDPCNLRIEGQRTPQGMLVRTDPVHDCAGNPVPDGTIVTFTATAANGKSTVDAPIKQGVARAQIAASGGAVISVASGVVMGNEIRVGTRP